MPKTEEFILDRIEKVGDCWEWRRAISRFGYGGISYNEEGKRRYEQAHRLAYRIFVGEIPFGLQLDHLCRNRRCVNPTHLEPVTPAENIRRGETGKFPKPWFHKRECSNGHTYTVENTYIKPNGAKDCRKCRRARSLKHKLKLQGGV